MSQETIAIGKLYDDLLKEGYEIQYRKNYELIIPDDIKIKTLGNKYVQLVAISRHKTSKHLIKVNVKTKNFGNREVMVTTDHICMIYNDYNFFENKAAKDIEIGDYVQVYDEKTDSEVIGSISEIKDMGTTEEYVYDCEVNDDIHAFYCNDILIHNSQFINIQCVTDDFKRKYALKEKINDWTDEEKLKLWEYMDGFVENDVNKFVQKLVQDWYHTEKSEVLRYSLEYIADTEIMESKKHYACHKILSEGPEVVNKIKYSGIELKKASVPKRVKEYLAEIYSSTLTKDWDETKFRNYINSIYPEFEKLDIEDISFWKGYSTTRESDGFLHMKRTIKEDGSTLGTTAISAACTYYNQLLEHLGLVGKYDTILLGDKVRFCYVDPFNKFGLKYIAFKDGQYPEEFREIFKVDYRVMFEKLIENPLKNFLSASRWRHNINPCQVNLMEVDDL